MFAAAVAHASGRSLSSTTRRTGDPPLAVTRRARGGGPGPDGHRPHLVPAAVLGTLPPVSSEPRRIVHVDMDAFYASVEQRDDRRLRGKPVAVGGDPSGRGVVCAASYEARVFGVRSAMAMARAIRLCPALVVVPPDFAKYRGVSKAVFEIFRSVTPLVEPLSLDEAYLDVTENAWQLPLASEVARGLKARIRETTGLTASAGVAPNKFLAKIASGWQKPDGLTVVSPSRVEKFLQQLPIDALWGVGPKTAAKLREKGLERLVDVRSVPLESLQQIVGSHAESLKQLALGIDNRPVQPNRPVKSSSSENTFSEDLVDLARIRLEVERLAARQGGWLERHAMVARTVTLKVRYDDFTTITRSSTQAPVRRASDLVALAVAMVDRTDAGRRPIRLLGVGLHNLVGPVDADVVEDTVPPLLRLLDGGEGA
ncbi:MAG: DNA polymerase IV [Vicinamibacterales bacterium]